jgi:hypothetical protein
MYCDSPLNYYLTLPLFIEGPEPGQDSEQLDALEVSILPPFLRFFDWGLKQFQQSRRSKTKEEIDNL